MRVKAARQRTLKFLDKANSNNGGNGQMAQVLVQAPIGLVHWQQFDQHHFATGSAVYLAEWPSNSAWDRLARYHLNALV